VYDYSQSRPPLAARWKFAIGGSLRRIAAATLLLHACGGLAATCGSDIGLLARISNRFAALKERWLTPDEIRHFDFTKFEGAKVSYSRLLHTQGKWPESPPTRVEEKLAFLEALRENYSENPTKYIQSGAFATGIDPRSLGLALRKIDFTKGVSPLEFNRLISRLWVAAHGDPGTFRFLIRHGWTEAVSDLLARRFEDDFAKEGFLALRSLGLDRSDNWRERVSRALFEEGSPIPDAFGQVLNMGLIMGGYPPMGLPAAVQSHTRLGAHFELLWSQFGTAVQRAAIAYFFYLYLQEREDKKKKEAIAKENGKAFLKNLESALPAETKAPTRTEDTNRVLETWKKNYEKKNGSAPHADSPAVKREQAFLAKLEAIAAKRAAMRESARR
jgi:hypothetical protein